MATIDIPVQVHRDEHRKRDLSKSAAKHRIHAVGSNRKHQLHLAVLDNLQHERQAAAAAQRRRPLLRRQIGCVRVAASCCHR